MLSINKISDLYKLTSNTKTLDKNEKKSCYKSSRGKSLVVFPLLRIQKTTFRFSFTNLKDSFGKGILAFGNLKKFKRKSYWVINVCQRAVFRK